MTIKTPNGFTLDNSGQRIVVDPVTRIEGHLRIEAETDPLPAGKITRHADEAKGWMQQISSNAEAWQRRANLALEQLRAHPQVDAVIVSTGHLVAQGLHGGEQAQGRSIIGMTA